MDENVKVLYRERAGAARLPVAAFGPGPNQAAGYGGYDELEFGVATQACDRETFVVSAHGDIDHFTAPELEQELLEAVQLGARLVVVDLTETTFFDLSAIHAVTRSAERVRAVGGQLSVVCDNPNIKKLLAITGTDCALPIHSTMEQAISLTPASVAWPEPWPAESRLVVGDSETSEERTSA